MAMLMSAVGKGGVTKKWHLLTALCYYRLPTIQYKKKMVQTTEVAQLWDAVGYIYLTLEWKSVKLLVPKKNPLDICL